MSLSQPRYTYKTPFGIGEIKKIKNKDTVRNNIIEHARNKVEEVPCHTAGGSHKQRTTCRCAEVFRNDNELFDRLVDLLMEFAYLSISGRRLFLHGIVSNAFLRKESSKVGEKKEPSFLLNGVSTASNDRCFVCSNALRRFFFIGKKQWKLIVDAIHLPDKPRRDHLPGNTLAMSKATQRVIDFIYDLAVTEGESYATRYVRLITGIAVRDNEKGHTELPSSYTRRKLYERFCYHSGYVVKSDALGRYGKKGEFDLRPNDDDLGELALWPTGTECLEVPSWSCFQRIWNVYLPFVTIRSPAKDTCIDCHVFRNQAKFKDHVTFDTTTANDQCSWALPLPEEESAEAHESVILKAAEHVRQALAQKSLASKKIRQAKECANSSIVTLVIDYCQNLEVPYLGIDQPGDTYYFSPIWVYCLGIVDTSKDKLFAYVYEESSCGKGANNVVSCIMHFLKSNYNVSTPEQFNKFTLNLIMDNCSGQNKNNTVIRACAFFVETGWCKNISVNFLVKGHTKNSCDRCFNLLKLRYHKSNIYTFTQCVEVLNTCEGVNVIDASDIHYNWDKMLDSFYLSLVTGTIRNNHIFKFKQETMGRVQLKTKTSLIDKQTVYQNLRKDHKYSASFKNQQIRNLCIQKAIALLQRLPKPGLAPIKQYHLFTKWRKVLPSEFKNITCPCPPEEIVLQFRKNSKKNSGKEEIPSVITNKNKKTNNKPQAGEKPGRKQTVPKKKKPNKRLIHVVEDSDDSSISDDALFLTPRQSIRRKAKEKAKGTSSVCYTKNVESNSDTDAPLFPDSGNDSDGPLNRNSSNDSDSKSDDLELTIKNMCKSFIAKKPTAGKRKKSTVLSDKWTAEEKSKRNEMKRHNRKQRNKGSDSDDYQPQPRRRSTRVTHSNNTHAPIESTNQTEPAIENGKAPEPQRRSTRATRSNNTPTAIQSFDEPDSAMENYNDPEPAIENGNDPQPAIKNGNDPEPAIEKSNELEPTILNSNETPPGIETNNEPEPQRRSTRVTRGNSRPSAIQNSNEIPPAIEKSNETEPPRRSTRVTHSNKTQTAIINSNEPQPAIENGNDPEPAIENSNETSPGIQTNNEPEPRRSTRVTRSNSIPSAIQNSNGISPAIEKSYEPEPQRRSTRVTHSNTTPPVINNSNEIPPAIENNKKQPAMENSNDANVYVPPLPPHDDELTLTDIDDYSPSESAPKQNLVPSREPPETVNRPRRNKILPPTPKSLTDINDDSPPESAPTQNNVPSRKPPKTVNKIVNRQRGKKILPPRPKSSKPIPTRKRKAAKQPSSNESVKSVLQSTKVTEESSSRRSLGRMTRQQANSIAKQKEPPSRRTRSRW